MEEEGRKESRKGINMRKGSFKLNIPQACHQPHLDLIVLYKIYAALQAHRCVCMWTTNTTLLLSTVTP